MVEACLTPNPEREITVAGLYAALTSVSREVFEQSAQGRDVKCRFGLKGWRPRVGPAAAAVAEAYLRDSILIDLGSGPPYGSGERLALSNGARGYIGIDKFNTRTLEPKRISEHRAEFELAHVQADMLEALKSLPDGCCCIAIENIDHIVIPDDGYRRDVALEIARVVKPGGIVFNGSPGVTRFLPGEIQLRGKTIVQEAAPYSWEAHHRVKGEPNMQPDLVKWDRIGYFVKK